MRLRLILMLIACCVLCGLIALEVPEFVKLSDDTSNDFVLVTSSHSVAPPVVIPYTPTLHVASPESNDRIDRALLLAGLMSRSADDLLQLGCVHRT
ncbi:MAG: hypothetical protein WBP79_00585 [Candidatus Acidiferrales bacterium]